MCIRDRYINYLRKENAEKALKANNFEKLLKLFSAQMDVSWFKGQTKDRYLEEWSRPGKLKTMLNWYKESPLIIPTSDTPQSNIDLSDLSLTIKCPHLLIWGKNDTALLPESYNGLRKYCENLKTITINNADHWPMIGVIYGCLLYTSPSPRDATLSRMPSSA